MPLCEWHRTGVEPAVHDFRNSLHRLAAYRAGHGHVVHIWSVEFDAFINVLVSFCNEICSAADALQMSALASPDRDRSTPVSVSGDGPVLDLFQPVSEALLSDEFRIPVDGIVVRDQPIAKLRHGDVP